jgi:hypothetical protein
LRSHLTSLACGSKLYPFKDHMCREVFHFSPEIMALFKDPPDRGGAPESDMVAKKGVGGRGG